MKVAIVYDRANKFGGAERVLMELNDIFPKAILYTSVFDKKKAKWTRNFVEIKTSFLQKIPFVKNNHEFFSLFMPIAFEQFDFSNYDLVISVSSEFSKGIITNSNTRHICYLLTPVRYLWSARKEYFKNKILKFVSSPIILYLKKYDLLCLNRPDVIVSISTEVQERVKKYYDVDTQIIFPPVNLNLKRFKFKTINETNYFLIVSRLVDYKKIDLAIKVCKKVNKKLVIIGSGRAEKKLKKIAKKSDLIVFKKNVSDEELVGYYKKAKAFLMPQEEDFGIAAVEAQSFGIPVIAYAKGGALDIVKDGKTGVLFNEQSIESLTNAIIKFEKMKFFNNTIKNNAKRFSSDKFKNELLKLL